ncbi:LacI family DNA-binding transcriptional regulator [Microbacterium aurantiacum]|uniref:LacI family DNA-binding transcriptional regulator n=1 Tax=Microbacterium aurantiacum TaxID=162393 RepID=UPI000C80717D|nr:LacI family DNA-binding transcriptional regulator [Microbacterium aurantiacum]
MTTNKSGRVTQREIAKIAGVSQATVSMVLNDRDYSNVRIPEATRARVLRAIEQTTYVADPAARRLAGLDNKILGIFTYEPALSAESMDFYGPLLNGIERAAERLSCDLLFFTASPLVDGSRSLFHKNTRFRLADGCLLLGQQMNGAELARLVAEGFPFVAVGRRDEPDVPYVGLDYLSLTGRIIRRLDELGHERAVYLHHGTIAPAAADRRSGIAQAASGLRLAVTSIDVSGLDRTAIARRVLDADVTAVITEDSFLAEAAAAAVRDAAPAAHFSYVALADVAGHFIGTAPLSGFDLRREAVASRALSLLQDIILTDPSDRDDLQKQVLLIGELVDGATLVEVRR